MKSKMSPKDYQNPMNVSKEIIALVFAITIRYPFLLLKTFFTLANVPNFSNLRI